MNNENTEADASDRKGPDPHDACGCVQGKGTVTVTGWSRRILPDAMTHAGHRWYIVALADGTPGSLAVDVMALNRGLQTFLYLFTENEVWFEEQVRLPKELRREIEVVVAGAGAQMLLAGTGYARLLLLLDNIADRLGSLVESEKSGLRAVLEEALGNAKAAQDLIERLENAATEEKLSVSDAVTRFKDLAQNLYGLEARIEIAEKNMRKSAELLSLSQAAKALQNYKDEVDEATFQLECASECLRDTAETGV